MSVQVKHRRDSASVIAGFTPAQGELIVDTTNNRVVVGDGATAGGFAAAKLSEVVPSSQLGVAGGVATLDAGGRLAFAQLPAAAQSVRRAVADVNHAALASDRLIAFTALTAARVVTLPAASAFPVATNLIVVDESGACSAANTITVNRAGADTIAGAASAVLNGAYMSLALQSDGFSKWTALGNESQDQLSLLGVGTPPDPANPLSVFGASALFNGANFSFTVNKSAPGNTASILFQDGFSLRGQIGLLGSDNLSFKVSPNGASFFTGLSVDSATGAVTLGNARTGVADSNYTALPTDREIAFAAITAARTVALPAASAFPAGHALVVLDESGAVSLANSITIARAGADTICGQTSARITTAYGYCRLISNGSSGWTIAGRSINQVVLTSSGTYSPTPGMSRCEVFLVAGGGGGGGGALQAAGAAASGGAGGGGGGACYGAFSAAQIGASQSVTIGAGGAGGPAAATASTAGASGGAGGATLFGTLLRAFGGGGGAGGQLAGASGGGGGGGVLSVTASGTAGAGGAGSAGASAGGSGAASAGVTVLQCASGGGGGVNGAAGTASGNSLYGSTGGGAGGGISAAGAAFAGAAAGFAPTGATYQNAAGGAVGAAGAAGATALIGQGFLGTGGGGGGSAATGAAGPGGAGATGGGGGGGGAALNGASAGAGGAGGAGYALVIEYF